MTPNFWTEGGDFSAADLELPHLGGPESPLPDEPGERLLSAAWLTFDELARRAEGNASAPQLRSNERRT